MAENLHFSEALQKEPVVVLTRYLEGGLSIEEIQQLEQLIAEDPFMADALEGLRSMPEPARAQQIGQELRFKAHKLLRAKRPIVSLYQFNQYATAAVAVLVVLFVATAAIILTSRIQGFEEPSHATETLADNQPKTNEKVETLSPTPESIPEELPVKDADQDDFDREDVVQEQNNESQRLNQRQISKPDIPSKVSQPATLSTAEKAHNKDDKSLDIIDSQAEFADTFAPSGLMVESITEVPADPTLSRDRLMQYEEAFTRAEDEAYQKALQAFNQSLVVTTIQFRESKELSAVNVEVMSEESKKAKKRKRNTDDKTAESAARTPSTSVPSTAPVKVPATAPANEEIMYDSAVNHDLVEEDVSGSGQQTREQTLQQVLYSQPTSSEAWLDLGKYYLEQGKKIKAQRYLKVAARSPVPAVSQEANELLKKVQNANN